jgi:hypothetical protein
MIFAHPLQVVRVVTASFKLAGVPRPKAFALRAEHLIAPFGFVHKNLATGAWLRGCFEKRNRSDSIRIANVVGIIAVILGFPALRTRVFVACSAFPGRRDEPVAVGMSTAVNELLPRRCVGRCGSLALQLPFGLQQIKLESRKLFDLLRYILNLSVNVLDNEIVRDGGLCCRKHGLFLSEENILLMFSEFALKKEFSEADVLNLRMSEVSVTEDALWSGDVVGTKECLVASSASGFSAVRAGDRFARRCIEIVGTYIAGHVLAVVICW